MMHPDILRRLSDDRRDNLLREANRDHWIQVVALPAHEPWRQRVALGLAGALVSAGTRLQHHYRPVADECVTC